MPRVAEASELDPEFPWADWASELRKAPTGALFFGPDDFGIMTPHLFRRKAMKELGPNVRVTVRGHEVLVALDA